MIEGLKYTANDLLEREVTVLSTKGIDTSIQGNKNIVFPRIKEKAIVVAVDKFSEGVTRIMYSEGRMIYIPNLNIGYLPINKAEIDFLILDMKSKLKMLEAIEKFIASLPEGEILTQDKVTFYLLSLYFKDNLIKTPEDLLMVLRDIGL